ncbi:MAG: tetratricopeptide repeat protein, partial [Phycisphaerales bacterium]|nr:tetratricopeptide repeat protein [Phycisphaerales bacterium]
LNPELNEDLVESDILVSRQMCPGTDDTPGDAAGAIEFLYKSVETHDYDPRVVSELVQMLFENKNIDSARSLLVKSQERHPDDESIRENLALFDSDDIVEIQIALIERSTKMSDVDKLISVSRIAAENGRRELWDESVRELNSLAPGDERVRELTFIHAITFGDFETADRIANDPNNKQIDSFNFKARIAMVKNQPSLAIELLEQSTATGTADSDVYRMLAMLYRDAGRFQDSVQSFEQALAIRPDNAQAITEYITTLVSAGKYEDALNIGRRLQQHASSNPTFMNLWLTLEARYGGDQGHDFAIRQREQMFELNPSDIENKYQLAQMYITSKDWSTARTLIDQLRAENDHIQLVQLDATWYADRGTVGTKNGKTQNGLVLANKIFADYIATLPEPVGSEPYIANAQFMLDRGRPDLAITAANQAVAVQSPETMLGSKLLGNIYSQINNHSQAVKAYQTVIESGADSNFEVHQLLINSLTRLERFEEARKIHDQFPEDLKTQIITMLYEADIASGLGDDARANTILNDVVSRYPNNPFGYIKRAQSMIGDETLFNDLLSDTSRAISLDPNNAQSYLVRAEGNFAIDRKEDGLKDLRTAIRLNPRLNNSIYSILNVLLTEPGRSSEAMDVAREVIDRRPEDSTLMARLGGLFSARKEWKKAAEIYGMAWDKNPSVSNGALYIDALVRMSPPDAETANGVIKALEKVLGNINEIPDLLAAQALVLQARGLNDFALQQITKAFILSVNEDDKITHWANNLSRFFENEPVGAQARYLTAIKGRNSPEVQNPDVQAWIDYFIARHLVKAEEIDPFAFTTLDRLKGYTNNPRIQVQAYRTHGSTLYSQKKFAQAADVWKAGLEHFSDDWQMNNNLAYVLSRELDQATEALPYGQAAIDKNIAQSEAYETMAGIYISLKKYDEAEQMIETGSKFIRSAKSRITMTLSSGRLELARGNMIEAHSRLNDCRSMLRSSPTAYPDLEEDIAAFEQEIKSAEG